jgi:hypothetical protein
LKEILARMRRPLLDIIGLTAALLGGCASEPSNPAFPVTSNQAQQAISRMRDDPKPLRRPLVVISGMFDPFNGVLLSNFYSGMTRDTVIIPVGVGFCGSFDECRQKVIEAVDKACPSSDPNYTAEVDVVGLSLGGLVGRYAAAPSLDPAHPRRLRVVRLFTISSPHAGAKIADWVSLTDFHRQFQPGSAFLRGLAREDANASYQLIPYVHLDDEIVGDRYASPPGRNPYWLANESLLPPHTAAMVDTRILADIALRLRGEKSFTTGNPVAVPGVIDSAATERSDAGGIWFSKAG